MSHFRIRSFTDAQIAAYAREYAAARPFPHVVIPDVLSAAPADTLPSFPALDAACWKRSTDAYQRGKLTLSDIQLVAEPLATMLRELMEPAVLQFVEQISGVAQLLPDPYLQGAGLFCSGAGGYMAPHTDSHVNERLGIYRRVNILVYLNPEWSEADGGCLELFDEADVGTPVRTILPGWGTMVLFRSDAHSVHGFTKPIADSGRVRRALAMYYYTAVDTAAFNGYSLTDWRRHDPYWTSPTSVLSQARLQLYRALRFSSKALAYLAHRAGPHLAN